MSKYVVIKCPKCGWEYLPAEIYYPDEILGKPSDILRDNNGHIVFFNGESLNLKEEFTCEHCGCTFQVNGKLDATSSVDDSRDFSDEWVETTLGN